MSKAKATSDFLSRLREWRLRQGPPGYEASRQFYNDVGELLNLVEILVMRVKSERRRASTECRD